MYDNDLFLKDFSFFMLNEYLFLKKYVYNQIKSHFICHSIYFEKKYLTCPTSNNLDYSLLKLIYQCIFSFYMSKLLQVTIFVYYILFIMAFVLISYVIAYILRKNILLALLQTIWIILY